MNKDWLAQRRIGGSDAPIIMEESPYATPYQLWERRLKGIEIEENIAMKRGKEWEPFAREKLEKLLNVILFPISLESSEYPFMTGNIDAIDLDGKIMAEIKMNGKERHEMAKQGKVPQEHYGQLQHYLSLKKLPGMYYFSCPYQEEGVIVEVARDDKYIRTMIEKEEVFWNCLQTFEPPELIAKDYLNQDENNEWLKLAKEIESLKIEDKRLKALHEKKEKELMEKLIELSGNKNSTAAGYRLYWKTIKGRVDYDKVPELQGINLNQYRKESSADWSFALPPKAKRA